ncbi:acyltransferase family protein [Paraburkholderia fungorum]|uniref:acyltransferase family protein n=1 Tax=Paraburkholderia fungorum TaxID=134537 RepID=UPI0038BCDA25
METTALAIAAVFGSAVLLAVPLGWLFKIQLKPGRFTHLDGMRAIAALMVVCAHYVPHAGLVMGAPVSLRLCDALGAVGVQIFFCITGFLFMRKAMNGPIAIDALISSRVRRIVPLYLVAMTAAIAVTLCIARSIPHAPQATFRDLVSSYAYGFTGGDIPSVAGMSIGGQAGQMWTLRWEWLFYLLVPFIATLLMRPLWAVAASSIAVGCAAYQYNGTLAPWVFFLPGMACGLMEHKIKPGAITQIALTVIGAIAFAVSLHVHEPAYGLAQLALCMIGFPAVLLGHRAPLSLKPLRLLGEVSYGLYMWHLVVVSVFWLYVQVWSDWNNYKTSGNKLPVAVASLIGLFVLSFVTYALFERPFMARAKDRPGTNSRDCQPG